MRQGSVSTPLGQPPYTLRPLSVKMNRPLRPMAKGKQRVILITPKRPGQPAGSRGGPLRPRLARQGNRQGPFRKSPLIRTQTLQGKCLLRPNQRRSARPQAKTTKDAQSPLRHQLSFHSLKQHQGSHSPGLPLPHQRLAHRRPRQHLWQRPPRQQAQQCSTITSCRLKTPI